MQTIESRQLEDGQVVTRTDILRGGTTVLEAIKASAQMLALSQDWERWVTSDLDAPPGEWLHLILEKAGHLIYVDGSMPVDQIPRGYMLVIQQTAVAALELLHEHGVSQPVKPVNPIYYEVVTSQPVDDGLTPGLTCHRLVTLSPQIDPVLIKGILREAFALSPQLPLVIPGNAQFNWRNVTIQGQLVQILDLREQPDPTWFAHEGTTAEEWRRWGIQQGYAAS